MSSNDNPPVIVEVSGIGQYTVVVEKDCLERLPPEQVVAEVSSRFKANPENGLSDRWRKSMCLTMK